MSTGMVPFLWGPMAWRQIHGMAHVFDTRIDDSISEQTADLFVLFLIALAWVLPCSTCRSSYTDYLLGFLKKDIFEQFFVPRKVQKLAFDLHNLVNKKLKREVCADFDLVQRRSEVWSVEFLPRELFGLLFIIALNFNANLEPDKEQHYHEFYSLLPSLLTALGHMSMAAALHRHTIPQPYTQAKILKHLYQAFVDWHPAVPSLDEIVSTYTLCRAE